MLRYYILDGHKAVLCSFMTWAKWFGSSDRHVANTEVGPFRVSTVFLGLDHQFTADGPPMIFETMLFDEDHKATDDYQTRCATWEQAEVMHKEAVAYAKGKMQ